MFLATLKVVKKSVMGEELSTVGYSYDASKQGRWVRAPRTHDEASIDWCHAGYVSQIAGTAVLTHPNNVHVIGNAYTEREVRKRGCWGGGGGRRNDDALCRAAPACLPQGLLWRPFGSRALRALTTRNPSDYGDHLRLNRETANLMPESLEAYYGNVSTVPLG